MATRPEPTTGDEAIDRLMTEREEFEAKLDQAAQPLTFLDLLWRLCSRFRVRGRSQQHSDEWPSAKDHAGKLS